MKISEVLISGIVVPVTLNSNVNHLKFMKIVETSSQRLRTPNLTGAALVYMAVKYAVAPKI